MCTQRELHPQNAIPPIQKTVVTDVQSVSTRNCVVNLWLCQCVSVLWVRAMQSVKESVRVCEFVQLTWIHLLCPSHLPSFPGSARPFRPPLLKNAQDKTYESLRLDKRRAQHLGSGNTMYGMQFGTYFERKACTWKTGKRTHVLASW